MYKINSFMERMVIMTARAINCITFDISTRHQKDGKNRVQTVAKVDKNPVQYKADTLRNVEDINAIVASFMNSKNKKFAYRAVLFIFGINTGFRCGDLLTFRVRDVLDDDGTVTDGLTLTEQKTGKHRTVYFNEAVKVALEWHIKEWNLDLDSYLFECHNSKAKYLDEFIYDEDGNVIGMSLTKEKYYMVGDKKYQRKPAPVKRRTASDWIMNEAKELGINGHYSSHCMRQTFAHFIGIDWTDEYNSLAVQKALGHSYTETTTKFYLSVDEAALRDKWMNLNLGLDEFMKHV